MVSLIRIVIAVALFPAWGLADSGVNIEASESSFGIACQNEHLQRFSRKQALLGQVGALESRGLGFGFSAAGAQPEPKSKARAFLQSLLLPGWGQHYAESKTMMKVFIGTEALLLASYLGFSVWSNWLEDEFKTFAATHAGVQTAGKSDQYFVDIGNFNDIFAYNQAQLQDRDVSSLYPETDEFFWSWDQKSSRFEFDDIRVRSDRAENRAQLTLAVIFLNHLVSAIHSTLAVHSFNKRLEDQGLGLNIRFKSLPSNEIAVQFSLVKAF